MKKMMLLLIITTVMATTLVHGMLSGGINYINSTSYFYADRNPPNITITSPSGSVNGRLAISLSTTITDTSSTTCTYRVTDSNGNTEISSTSYDCVSDTFSVSSDGDYIMYVTSTDSVNSGTTSSTFTVSTGGQISGGGGGGSTTIIKKEGVESIIDFGQSSKTFTIISTPTSLSDSLLIKNVGSLDIKNAKLELTQSLSNYLSVQFCDETLITCSSTVSLISGETGFLKFAGVIDTSLGKGAEGFLRITERDKTHELPLLIDRPPLYDVCVNSFCFGYKYVGDDEFTGFLLVYGLTMLGLFGGGYLIVKGGGL
jgi:hypothetical protein